MPTPTLKWKFTDKVEITTEDITWFRACRSAWLNTESGAPTIVPGDMPAEEFAELELEDLNFEQMYDKELSAVLSRLERIVCAFFLNARFTAGSYSLRRAPDSRTSFVVTDDHIRLLRLANWRAAAIDGKRPYGDYTHYTIDMARTLGLPVTRNADTGYDEIGAEAEVRMKALHREMLFVLQAYIEHAELSPGRWLIPYEGWDGVDGIFGPRCAPPTAAQVAAYQRAIAVITEDIERSFNEPPTTFRDKVIRQQKEVRPSSVASDELRTATAALFTMK